MYSLRIPSSRNKNPNSPEDVPATALFTTASVDAVGRWLGAGYDLRAAEFRLSEALVEEASAAAASLQDQAVNLTQTVNVFKTDESRQPVTVTADREQATPTKASRVSRVSSTSKPAIVAPQHKKIAKNTATVAKEEWEEF